MGHSLKNGSPLEKWITLGKKWSHLDKQVQKAVTIGKTGHTWKIQQT